MSTSLAEAAISLLLEMAERGDVDPWDVNVIDVIDRFLSRLSPQANTRDLSESGQAFLYASMLVYLKAMALGRSEEPDPVPDEAPLVDVDAWATWSSVGLENVLRPRAVPRINRTRPITLKELIQQIQELETVLQTQTQSSTRPTPPRLSRKQIISAIAHLAHPENLLDNASELETVLLQAWQHTPQMEFDQLVYQFAAHQPGFLTEQGPTIEHRVQTFWALLLMASRSQVELHQTEFYRDLTISPCVPVPIPSLKRIPPDPEALYSTPTLATELATES